MEHRIELLHCYLGILKNSFIEKLIETAVITLKSKNLKGVYYY